MASLSGSVEDSFPVFGEVAVSLFAMLCENVVASKPHMAQLACNGCSGDGSARSGLTRRLCNAARIIMHGQALRCHILFLIRCRLNLRTRNVWTESEAPSVETVPWSIITLAKE